jgi:transcriptional regulator with XRE-family HTH domain
VDNARSTRKSGRVTLRTLADQLGLTAGTISAVLNHSAAAKRIPQHTQERIFAAAREMNYQPNPLARALRAGAGVIPVSQAREISGARGAVVLLGAHQFDRAMMAIQQAGLRVHDDFSVLDLADVPASLRLPGI